MSDLNAMRQSGRVAYGLARPTLQSIRAALLFVFDGDERIWTSLLAEAGRADGSVDRDDVRRVIDVMCGSGDRIVAVCGRAQRIRLVSYDRLAAVATALDAPPEG